jgi:hypothetical protein
MNYPIRRLLAGALIAGLATAGLAAPAMAAVPTAHATVAVPHLLTSTDGCTLRHGPGFCGTWKDVNNGQYVAASGTPKEPNSSSFAFFGFRAATAPAADSSFYAFHPAQFSADNGAVLQFSNDGRSEVPVRYLAADAAGHMFWASFISPTSEWIYDGVGFYNGASGQFLVIGLHGALSTSPNPLRESQTDFVTAS